MCPTTERDLADGIGRGPRPGRRRLAALLGSDSHAVIDPFEEARALEMNERAGQPAARPFHGGRADRGRGQPRVDRLGRRPARSRSASGPT
jgi:cytosine/adenosine deaminase-related metal-dependent hydrolase